MTAYLFDIDGVLTDPVKKRVTEEKLYRELIKRLQNGSPVGINTGRSTTWLLERLVKPLFQKADDKSIFVNFFVLAEKGGTWIIFQKEGTMQHESAQKFFLSNTLHDRVKELVEKKYSDSMFFDDTKETMISIEMHDGYALSAFHKKQLGLIPELVTILAERGDNILYTIDPSNISTDIQRIEVGKAHGADRFLEFLQDKKISPTQFIAFGDSQSDFEMADELEKKGKKVTFVCTGDKTKLGAVTKSYPIVWVGGYTRGTLSYLEKEWMV